MIYHKEEHIQDNFNSLCWLSRSNTRKKVSLRPAASEPVILSLYPSAKNRNKSP